jgi:hypothetical protein
MIGSNLPRWYSVLPAHIRPDQEKVAKLEELRVSLRMRDESFIVALASSPWAVVRSQEATLQALKKQIPDADERKLWTAVVLARYENKRNSPAPTDPPPEEIQRRMDNIQDIVRTFTTWDDVLSYILEMDSAGAASDPESPASRISVLLSR